MPAEALAKAEAGSAIADPQGFQRVRTAFRRHAQRFSVFAEHFRIRAQCFSVFAPRLMRYRIIARAAKARLQVNGSWADEPWLKCTSHPISPSYFSLETDLASEMSSWPEFKSGAGYAVELVTPDHTEAVSVELVERTVDESAYVRVTASVPGPLFDRALGHVVYVLAAHSDNHD